MEAIKRLTVEEIGAQVVAIIGDVTGATPSEVTMDASLVHDLGFDELDLVELVMEIEQVFDFAIDEDRADGFVHVRDVVGYLQKEIGAPA